MQSNIIKINVPRQIQAINRLANHANNPHTNPAIKQSVNANLSALSQTTPVMDRHTPVKQKHVALNIHIGKLIQKVEISIPDQLTPQEQQRLQTQCLNLLPHLKENMMQSIASFSKYASSVLGEQFDLKLHL